MKMQLLEEPDSEAKVFRFRGRKICSLHSVMKIIFSIFAVAVVILLALVIVNSVSLKSFNDRLEILEEKLGTLQNEKPSKGPATHKVHKHRKHRTQHKAKENVSVAVTYVRWGRMTCPNNTGATLVYAGYAGGSDYRNKGGAANYVCLTSNPIYEKYLAGQQDYRGRMYGAEYETGDHGIHPKFLHNHEVPCAVCHVTKRAVQIMIPGRNVCPKEWTREYKGYLMAEKHDYHRTMYTCVDENPDYWPGTRDNKDGALFHFVEAVCGALPCKPYIEGQEMTCAVCTR